MGRSEESLGAGREQGVAYIHYNRQRDLPLMIAVRNATFISHSQLWKQLESRGIESSKRSFGWRLQRLTDAGVIEKLPPRLPYSGAVYTITRLGLECLEACGEGLVSLHSDSKTLANPAQIQHYLEIVEIKAALERSGILKEWTDDVEIRSMNQAIGVPLAKDYDAIAELELDGVKRRLAIEYERHLKSAERYRAVVEALKNEDQIDLLLYLTSSLDLLYQLIGHFSDETFPVFAAPSSAFCPAPLTARLHVADQSGTSRTTLAALLKSPATLAIRK
jgi:hypothetical protein